MEEAGKPRGLTRLMSSALKIHSSESACQGAVEHHRRSQGVAGCRRISQMFKEQVARWPSVGQIPTGSR